MVYLYKNNDIQEAVCEGLMKFKRFRDEGKGIPSGGTTRKK